MQSVGEQLAPVAARLRAEQSKVTPVSQVELTLRSSPELDFFQARQTALRWIAGRAGRPLPEQAWAGSDFDLEEVGPSARPRSRSTSHVTGPRGAAEQADAMGNALRARTPQLK